MLHSNKDRECIFYLMELTLFCPQFFNDSSVSSKLTSRINHLIKNENYEVKKESGRLVSILAKYCWRTGDINSTIDLFSSHVKTDVGSNSIFN